MVYKQIMQGNQNLDYILMDTSEGTTIKAGKLPISPLSTLMWCGFSEVGVINC